MRKIDKNAFSIPAHRQRWILDYIAEHGVIKIKEAKMLCGVSEATLRRDLDELTEMGLVERTHGGAVMRLGTTFEKKHTDKKALFIEEKKRIATAASEMVHDGDSVFLDSGTTAYYLAECLYDKQNLTIITNNLDIAYSVPFNPSVTLIVTGGVRREGYEVLLGNYTQDFIRSLYVDISFLGGDAVSGKAVFNSNFMEIGVKQSIIDIGKKKVLLVDHSKFEKKALAKVADITRFDVVITDDKVDTKVVKEIESKNVKVHLV